ICSQPGRRKVRHRWIRGCSFAGAWRVAAMEAAKETAAVKEQAAEEVKAANKQFEDALDAIKKLEADSEQDAAQIEALKAQVLELQTMLTASGLDNAALKTSIEHLRMQDKKYAEELGRLHRENEAERQRQHDETARLNAEHAAKLDKMTADVERLQRELGDMQKKSDQAERERDETRFKLEHADKQLSECSDRLKSVEQKQEAAMVERENAIKETAQLQGQVLALTAQNSELLAKLGARTTKAKDG
ncbi:MAG: hypothetical protein ACRD3W_15230, partial [Terriglobales bacterium]